MLTIEQVQRDAYTTACEKGWHVRPLVLAANPLTIDHDRVLAKLQLVHTELTEAQDCLDAQPRDLVMRIGDNDKPESFVVEMADAIVRLGDLCGALAEGHPEWFMLRCTDLGGWSGVVINDRSTAEIDRWMLGIRKHIDRAAERVRVNDWRNFTAHLSLAVQDMTTVCAGLGVDLSGAIVAKMAYNRTRSHRHGGKSA